MEHKGAQAEAIPGGLVEITPLHLLCRQVMYFMFMLAGLVLVLILVVQVVALAGLMEEEPVLITAVVEVVHRMLDRAEQHYQTGLL
jgi:hypothetical protein